MHYAAGRQPCDLFVVPVCVGQSASGCNGIWQFVFEESWRINSLNSLRLREFTVEICQLTTPSGLVAQELLCRFWYRIGYRAIPFMRSSQIFNLVVKALPWTSVPKYSRLWTMPTAPAST